MTSAIDETVSNGYYYYGIHVDSQLISPRHSDDFLEGGDERLADFLTGIKNNSMNDAGSTNPRFELDSPPSAFNFDTMLPGRIFTMDGVRYRYLEQQGPHHLIIRNNPLTNTSFTNQNAILTSFYNGLTPEVQAIVAPVSIPTNVPGISDAQAAPWTGEGERWLPGGLVNFPAAAGDETSVNPSGNPQAFALSLADVVRLSTPEGAFPNHAARISTHNRWWWTRTPGASGTAWHVGSHGLDGQLSGWGSGALDNIGGGVRPALLVNNPN